MIIIGLILVYLLGWSVLNNISNNFSNLEKLGLAYLIGISIETFFMFLLTILNVNYSIILLFLITIFFTVALNYNYIINYKRSLQKIRDFKIKWINIKKLSLLWILLLTIVTILTFGSVAKSLYWPTSAYDNVAGYDLIGKVMAEEGTFNNSLFENDNKPMKGLSNRAKYPPLVAGSFAFAYLCGLETSKILTSLFFISFIFLFYSLLCKYTTKISAIFFTFLAIITPEFFAFTSLSTTNIPAAIYIALAIIYLFIYLDTKTNHSFLIFSILLGLSAWTRSDSIVFNISTLIFLIYHFRKNLLNKNLILYCILAFTPFLAWIIYSNIYIQLNQDVFVNSIFWDEQRISMILFWSKALLFNTQQYGISFYAFIILILINLKNIRIDKSAVFLLLVLFGWFIYTFMFYQLDPDKMGASLETIMKASYKRGLFIFIPLVWFYNAINKFSLDIFKKIDNLLLVDKQST